VLSVAHVDLVPAARLVDVRLAPIAGERAVVPGRQQRLPFDHDAIVAEAVRWARAAYTERPDPSGLLGEAFTLYQLRKLHEAVLGERETRARTPSAAVWKHSFQETGQMSSGTVGKPARLFTRPSVAHQLTEGGGKMSA